MSRLSFFSKLRSGGNRSGFSPSEIERLEQRVREICAPRQPATEGEGEPAISASVEPAVTLANEPPTDLLSLSLSILNSPAAATTPLAANPISTAPTPATSVEPESASDVSRSTTPRSPTVAELLAALERGAEQTDRQSARSDASTQFEKLAVRAPDLPGASPSQPPNPEDQDLLQQMLAAIPSRER